MKRSLKTLVVFTITLLSSAFVRAENSPEISQESFFIEPPFESPAHRFSFQQFDSWNGTRILDSVTLSLAGTLSAAIEITNNDSNSAFIAPTVFATFTVTPWNGSSQKAEINYLGDYVEYSAGETKKFDDLTNQFSFNDVLTTDLDSYIGSGNLEFNIDANTRFRAAGGAQTYVEAKDYFALGELSIAYTYHTVPVPEPSSAVLATFAGMLFLLRRRRN